MKRLSNYLIIGASSEVGISFLKSLEQKAAQHIIPQEIQVIAHYSQNKELLIQLKEEFIFVSLKLVQCDLRQADKVKEMIEEIAEQGAPDCIIWLAAGKLKFQKLKKLDWEKTRENIEIQVHALADTGACFLPLMARKRFGKVVVMLSECTLGMPPKFMTEYVMVKYATLGLMKSMSMEYADKGVNVNGISPGMMETKFLSEIDERFIAMNAEGSVKKRNAQLEEVTEAIHFLTSKGSDYMNGVNLNVSGGNR